MYCRCGCGSVTSIATKTRSHLGHVKGAHVPYIRGHANGLKSGPYKQIRWVEEDRGYSTPCWVWQLGQMGGGYGCEWNKARGRMVGAHIPAYERAYGPVPGGLEVDHLCHVRLCVNPTHLEAVTHAVNVARSDHKTTSFNAKKTHCPKGHPYSGDNLYVEKTGQRRCRTCRALRRAS